MLFADVSLVGLFLSTSSLLASKPGGDPTPKFSCCLPAPGTSEKVPDSLLG